MNERYVLTQFKSIQFNLVEIMQNEDLFLSLIHI